MKKVKPFYRPLTLPMKQILMALAIKGLTGWKGLGYWARGAGKVFRMASGAVGIGCFGYPIHPVYEITSKCNLKCIHCHARGGERSDELCTEEAKRVIDNLADVKDFRMLVFTGGEPFARKDIFELIRHARDLGFEIVIATNATLITKEVANRLRREEVVGIAASIDSVHPEKHDWFRGVRGAYEAAIKGIENSKNEDLYIQINITVSKMNLKELPDLLKLADKLGAYVVLLYQLIPFGRGEGLPELALSPEEFREVIEVTKKVQSEIKPVVAPVGLPQYWAYLISKSKIIGKLAKRLVAGCIAGKGMFYVKPNGDVWSCCFLPVKLGNLVKDSARDIWYNNELLDKLRSRRELRGICDNCELKDFCGGCRSRAYAYHKDPLAEDPLCPIKDYVK